VLTWRSVKNLRGEIGENSLVSSSVLGFPYQLAVPAGRSGKYSSMV
jgi:hypothetical protein